MNGKKTGGTPFMHEASGHRPAAGVLRVAWVNGAEPLKPCEQSAHTPLRAAAGGRLPLSPMPKADPGTAGLPGEKTSGTTGVLALQRAETMRRSALSDMNAGKYRSAYRKIVRAAELHPFSDRAAGDRQAIAALYRNRLDTCLYCILVPWLPFFIYTRLLATAEQEAGGGQLFEGGYFLPVFIGFYALSFGAAGWIYTIRSWVK